MENSDNILSVRNLRVSFRQGERLNPAVDGTSFSIRRGEMLSLVGESGSGKSVTALAIMGLLPKPAAVVEGGSVIFNGKELLHMPEDALNRIRGDRISMIFQEPMTALNPVLTIGWQIEEVLKLHRNLTAAQCHARTTELLAEVGIPDPEARCSDYPHQLSGGMRQRVMIAMALACRPELLIADEPTTALDVTVQAQIMELLAKLRSSLGTAILLITHSLALVREQSDRVAVMYAGAIVEEAPRDELFANPAHPYTRLLLKSVPSVNIRGRQLAAIAGQVPAPSEMPPGCRFAPRCPLATAACTAARPAVYELRSGHTLACLPELAAKPIHEPGGGFLNQRESDSPVILDVRELKVWFKAGNAFFKRHAAFVHAVDDISFTLRRGETLALVGESGCGKTTVGKSLVRLVQPTSGSILLEGTDLCRVPSRKLHPYRKRIQMIFQDPFASLDPRLMVGETISEGMDAHGLFMSNRQQVLTELLANVGLPADSINRYPHQFSGGQRQRIGLARALAVQPEIVVCDECTSALDVSVQAQILNLLRQLQRSMNLAYLFITHDLSVVSFLADRVAVMYLGRILEEGTTHEVLSSPAHPYTRALIAAAPRLDPATGIPKLHLQGEVPSPINPPGGCPFHTRCPNAAATCSLKMPEMTDVSPTHRAACYLLAPIGGNS